MPIPSSQKPLLHSQTSDPYRLERRDSLVRSHSSSGHSIHSCIPSPRFFGAFILAVFIFVAHNYDIASREPQLRASVFFSEYRSAFNQRVTPPLHPEGAVVADTELFYMLPSAKDTLGVLIHFHGCNHAGEDMFRLPEDRIMAMSALRRGLAVLSITSTNRKTGCWSHHDVEHVDENKVVDQWMESVGLDASLPRIGMGASSGGSILFSMYKVLGLKSLASYIVSKGYKNEDMVPGDDGVADLPAIAFVHMPRDDQTVDAIPQQVSALKALGVPTKVFEAQPHPFDLELCDQRLPEIGDRRCQIFLSKVKKDFPNLIDKDNNVLQNYQNGGWELAFEDSKLDDDLRHTVGAPPTNRGELKPIHFSGHSWAWAAMAEELSVAYAQHEMTSEHRNQVLDFLMEHANIQFESDSRQRRGLLGVIAQLKRM